MKRVHLHISGRVQGVWFRASTRDKARELGLSGWVRNLDDGRVEAVAEGDEETLRTFVDWCREGPPLARVHGLDSRWEPARGDLKSFEVR